MNLPERGPIGICGDVLLFKHSQTPAEWERWEKLLKAGLLEHLPQYQWDEKQCLMRRKEK